MAQRYNNRVELKDGEVILFHRAGAKRPIWHMRLHVRGMIDMSTDAGRAMADAIEVASRLRRWAIARGGERPSATGDYEAWTPGS